MIFMNCISIPPTLPQKRTPVAPNRATGAKKRKMHIRLNQLLLDRQKGEATELRQPVTVMANLRGKSMQERGQGTAIAEI